MSKHETPLTLQYWHEVGGTLIEEFPAVRQGAGNSPRLIDGVIIEDGSFERRKSSDVEITGQNIIVIQVKASRLGMSLMGQALFSKRLMERFKPARIRCVAICTKGDTVLEPFLKEYGIELVVYPQE